jgi:hypothetical protein
VCIVLWLSDPSAQVQHSGACTDRADGEVRVLVTSYHSLRFFTLLVLAGDGRVALRWGGASDSSHITGEVCEFSASDEALFRKVFHVDAYQMVLLGVCAYPRYFLALGMGIDGVRWALGGLCRAALCTCYD